jgi:hypothetical protein
LLGLNQFVSTLKVNFGPPDMEPVIIALDDPMRVDRAAR